MVLDEGLEFKGKVIELVTIYEDFQSYSRFNNWTCNRSG